MPGYRSNAVGSECNSQRLWERGVNRVHALDKRHSLICRGMVHLVVSKFGADDLRQRVAL